MEETDLQEAVLAAMGEAALLRAPSGEILWVNPAFCALFGGEPESWLGQDFGPARVSDAAARCRYEGEAPTRRGRRWIEWEETALDDGRVLSVGRDITGRRAEAGAAPAPAGNPEAARKVGKAFLSAVTHELRTPLHGVLGMAGLLEQTGLKPDQSEYVAAIRGSGEHLLGMINDVLDAARLQAGALELEEGEVDCARMVRSVVELLFPKALDKGLEIAAVIDPRLPAVVRGDEGRLRQVLFNLAGAALLRTEKGGLVVSAYVESKRAADGNATIALSVTDEGPSFSEGARLAMVEPALMREREEAGGPNAGMSLVVARRLVEAMDGALEIESRPRSGARFTVRLTLPVIRAAAPEEASALADRQIVVASGSAVLRQALCEQAIALGAAAVGAPTPGAALRELKQRPGAALLGEAAWRERLADAVRVAARAGLLLRPDQRDLIPDLPALGFDFYLMKPVRAASLAAQLGGGEVREDTPPEPTRQQRDLVHGARILLAEDNPVNALLASTMLRGEGCRVDVVCDGQEAIDAVRRASYDLVLMDVRMPVKDGLQATKEIRALGGRHAETPIVALTANAFHEDRKACFAAGMDDFATKPIDMGGVANLLVKWTQGPKQAKLA